MKLLRNYLKDCIKRANNHDMRVRVIGERGRLDEDIRQEILYGKVETPLKMPEHYEPIRGIEELVFSVGDHVKVTSGSFENMSGVIWKIKKSTVEIGIRLFGQDMSMEVPIEFISKNFL